MDIENPLTNSQLDDLFLVESQHMVSEFYTHGHGLQSLDFKFPVIRTQIISLILQLTSGSFDPFLSCLAVTYLDRFFSSHGIPVGAKPWMMRLLAMTCVSLAAKMMKIEFSFNDFQCEEGFIFDSQTIERLEILILGALKWRMRSITPFAFLQFFTSFFKLKDPPLIQALKTRAIDIIFKAQKEIKLLEFKPSIVAASAVLCACNELFPIQFPCLFSSLSSCPRVNKEKLVACVNTMEGSIVMVDNAGYDNDEMPWRIIYEEEQTMNVLDQAWSTTNTTPSALTQTTITTTTITTTNNNSMNVYDDNVQPETSEEDDEEKREIKKQRII